MISGTISTLLLGIKVDGEFYTILSRNLAFVLSGLGTLMTGLLAYWNLDAYWLQRKAILNEMIALQERLRYVVILQPASINDELRSIFDQYMRITGRHGEYWEGMLSR